MPEGLDLVTWHLAATWGMVGVIWVMQLISYPAFGQVDGASFPAYHKAHCDRITLVVVPLMTVELLTGLLLLESPPAALDGERTAGLWVATGLLAVVWGVTGLVSAPLHGALRSGNRAVLVPRLVRTNWVRTLAWTARGWLVAGWTG